MSEVPLHVSPFFSLYQLFLSRSLFLGARLMWRDPAGIGICHRRIDFLSMPWPARVWGLGLCLEYGSSQIQNLALTVLFVPILV